MDLNECTLVELRQMAKDKGVKNVSKLRGNWLQKFHIKNKSDVILKMMIKSRMLLY